MKSKTITFPSRPLSKKEEITLLREIADAVPADSYLRSLFSSNLIEAFIIETTNDFSTDIVGSLATQLAQARTENLEELRVLRNKVASLEAFSEGLRNQNATLVEQLARQSEEREATFESYKSYIAILKEELAKAARDNKTYTALKTVLAELLASQS